MFGLLLLSLRSLLASANDPTEDEEALVEDAPANSGLPFPDGKMPSPDELLKMLDSMKDLSDEDKASIRDSLLSKASQAGLGEEATQHVAASIFGSQIFILLAMLAIIALIFVFFSYKLYKSLSERERKREEKKKNKQMKKKK